MTDSNQEPELISSYSRAQAIKDGVLIDVTDTAKEAGFKFPVAVTSKLWNEYIMPPENIKYQDVKGRLWDALYMLHRAIKNSNSASDYLEYEVLFIMENGQQQIVKIISKVSPGDNMEPVITLMLPGED